MVVNIILVIISGKVNLRRSFLSFFIDELVIPGKTQAESSTVYGHTYFPNNTVDGDFRQQIAHCSHTQNEKSITEAWLRINLLKAYSIKQIKFWYRSDGSYHLLSILMMNV